MRHDNPKDTSFQSDNMDNVESVIDPANIRMAVPIDQRSQPQTWREVFSRDAHRQVRDSMAELILDMTGTLTNPLNLIRTAMLMFPTAFLTVATGTPKLIRLIHNTAEEYIYFGIIGFNTRSATVELNLPNP